jgi:ABC-type multidrug transport system fused ATPase/permease subunit
MKKYIHTTFRLWKLLKPFHKDFYIQIFLIASTKALDSIFAFIVGHVFTNVSVKNIDGTVRILFIYFLTLCVYWITTYFQEKHKGLKTDHVILEQYVQAETLKKVLSLTISEHQNSHSAIKQDIIQKGEGSLINFIRVILFELLPLIFLMLATLISMYIIAPILCVLFVISLVFFILWSTHFNKTYIPLEKENIANWRAQRKIRQESFTHMSLIKFLSIEKTFIAKYIKERLDSVLFYNKVNIISLTFRNKRNFSIGIFEMCNLFIVIYLFYKGELQLGYIYTAFSLSSHVFWSLANFLKSSRDLIIYFIDIEKYLELMDTKPDFIEDNETKFKDGDIVFKNLSFKYPKGDDNVLNNLNLTIPQGKKVAFVGPSGSGKTTITRLLLRAYNYTQEGSIQINGVELKEIDAHSLRRNIGYVEQHVDLFDDTVKNNILFGVDEKEMTAAEKNLESIAKLARIDEFYHRLGELKFETQIGERGIKLSGGERQRIGIARAIIKNPSILIFDEATSALDTINEKYIKEAIDDVSRGRTTIIIAHRLSTVVESDIIFVMDKGEVVASGSHNELLKKSTVYKDLIKHQELS